ncbi:chorismate--pyruvate lyase family protein [Thalassotalea castellviae]|uniref:Probable chorismate pyruvate-lyase n=1 Tax=Thalassotalea castellviae TaxID=3075612 RepID=A0ABU3A584_9GAMM|nr:chorismate lyase [Thalassotalea sp. W431]MDT0604141.1 chorismate lyase [Thalassotalea sp. W431]
MVQQTQPHHLFPVQLHTKWCREKTSQLNLYLQDWLLDPSSLTARLKQHCQDFRVQVLGQCIETCSVDESNEDILAGEEVLVREVLLFCDNKPQVFARSLLPLRSLTGKEAHLAKLGEQSLGQVIFNHPELKRKGIEVASFDQQSRVAELASYYQLSVVDPLWGRRSVFVVNDKPLMVAEVFLPNSFAYQDKVNQ